MVNGIGEIRTSDQDQDLPLVSVGAIFDKDPDAPAVLDGTDFTAVAIFNVRRRREILAAVEPYGVTRSEELTAALELYNTLESGSLIGTPIPPSAYSLTAETAGDALRDFIDKKVRNEAGQEVLRAFVLDAGRRLSEAFSANVDAVFGAKKLRSEFDRLAAEFVELYPIVKGLRSLSEAAEADTTGQTLGAWHRARSVVGELDRITDMIVEYAAPLPNTLKGAPKGALGAPRVLTIGVDPGPGYQSRLLEVGFDGPRLAHRVDYQWSNYGPALESGSTLSLPVDREAWADRAHAYRVG
ncbi:hypothetical protein [Pseudonocardia sp. D17]|uniref:hypothetical protein n=1 Tax=Pseudonocardia sp. D17 TaxID=882661 RepID=UPI002B3AD74D|nr:hypothetical protein PSD17_66640 [Pseudonocardia sp. D17]